MIPKFKIGLCQMEVVDSKQENISKALKMIESAASNGAELVILPEMFNCPYDNTKFLEYAESVDDSVTLYSLSEIASKLNINLIAGSIPEKTEQGIYNTSFVFNPNGEIIGFHRKMHLFDIEVPGQIFFKESDTLESGDIITVIETGLCKIGLGICYDMRFPELSRLMALQGAELLVFPGAFNMTTGPAHWETLIRCRSLDNQVYVAAASPARNIDASYVSYGHSMVCDPWGSILKQAKFEETIIYAEIDLNRERNVREELPLLKNRRKDIYQLKNLK
ncbi:carbon-nitrogen hydrolase family protein [Methanobacterium alcaliphilum]|uniref:carbon-nitrogen hydrolase family protein n=1 Tax=Methanobacterium alcaliphilum TaxID=392018 RepID=UPI00200B705E|nr:carbon-nitrogen hydrolase family protein [Methanobacterium alcaliphilum]MCK9151198.1 carbon-nitrogen hydrolase family protein [Methanobacterium alcaliphilum]